MVSDEMSLVPSRELRLTWRDGESLRGVVCVM